ncbi:hypothetical protein VTK26DRAFT_2534 [Humicola hyalothermophila]
MGTDLLYRWVPRAQTDRIASGCPDHEKCPLFRNTNNFRSQVMKRFVAPSRRLASAGTNRWTGSCDDAQRGWGLACCPRLASCVTTPPMSPVRIGSQLQQLEQRKVQKGPLCEWSPVRSSNRKAEVLKRGIHARPRAVSRHPGIQFLPSLLVLGSLQHNRTAAARNTCRDADTQPRYRCHEYCGKE